MQFGGHSSTETVVLQAERVSSHPKTKKAIEIVPYGQYCKGPEMSKMDAVPTVTLRHYVICNNQSNATS